MLLEVPNVASSSIVTVVGNPVAVRCVISAVAGVCAGQCVSAVASVLLRAPL